MQFTVAGYCIVQLIVEDAVVERQSRTIAVFARDVAVIVNTADGISLVVRQFSTFPPLLTHAGRTAEHFH